MNFFPSLKIQKMLCALKMMENPASKIRNGFKCCVDVSIEGGQERLKNSCKIFPSYLVRMNNAQIMQADIEGVSR